MLRCEFEKGEGVWIGLVRGEAACWRCGLCLREGGLRLGWDVVRVYV